VIYLKSNHEIDIVRQNGAILAETFERLNDFIKPGVTTAEINRLVEETIAKHGATPSFLGYRGFPTAACVSVNEVVVHGIPSSRKLVEGDIVSVDIGAFRDGFHADAARTYPVGAVSPDAAKLIKAAEDAFFSGCAKAVVGGRVSDISHAVQLSAEAAGFGVVRDMLGHGIGRSLHEDPPIPNYGPAGKGPKLRHGMLIAIEPMITMGDYRIVTSKLDGWTCSTKDGKLASHYENTVAITREGLRILTCSSKQ
jgi:methionyl aminopeptidase